MIGKIGRSVALQPSRRASFVSLAASLLRICDSGLEATAFRPRYDRPAAPHGLFISASTTPTSSLVGVSPTPTCRGRDPAQGHPRFGGACIWDHRDADAMMAQGVRPLGLEIGSASAYSSDAHHIIITPSKGGPRSPQASLDKCRRPKSRPRLGLHATQLPATPLRFGTRSRCPSRLLFTALAEHSATAWSSRLMGAHRPSTSASQEENLPAFRCSPKGSWHADVKCIPRSSWQEDGCYVDVGKPRLTAEMLSMGTEESTPLHLPAPGNPTYVHRSRAANRRENRPQHRRKRVARAWCPCPSVSNPLGTGHRANHVDATPHNNQLEGTYEDEVCMVPLARSWL